MTIFKEAASEHAQEIIEITALSLSRAGYKAPEVVLILDKMPLNASGKIDRVTLKKMAAERHDAEISD